MTTPQIRVGLGPAIWHSSPIGELSRDGDYPVMVRLPRAAALNARERILRGSADQSLDLRNDLKQVADQAVIGHLEDRCLAVLVDRDDGARILDAGQVLDCTRDPHCDL